MESWGGGRWGNGTQKPVLRIHTDRRRPGTTKNCTKHLFALEQWILWKREECFVEKLRGFVEGVGIFCNSWVEGRLAGACQEYVPTVG